MTAKQTVRKWLNSVPEDASWDELEEQLHILRKVQEGEQALLLGQVYSNDEAKAYLLKCLGK